MQRRRTFVAWDGSCTGLGVSCRTQRRGHLAADSNYDVECIFARSTTTESNWMRDTILPFSPPYITEDEVGEVASTLRSGWVTTGVKAKELEERFSISVGTSAALALSSGTAALHTGLAVLGIGPGDLVFTTPMTFCSTLHVVEHLGARPVLVDVETETLNIDPARLNDAVKMAKRAYKGRGTQRPRALLPVHLYGHPCDMDSLLRIAAENDLAIVEDAAHALLAKYRGKPIGSRSFTVGDQELVSCFSFYATKNLTTIEGGMLAGPSPVIDEARLWSLHGMSRDAWKRYSWEGSWQYDVVRPGFKYNMPDVLACIGLQQLLKLPQLQRRRREIAERYNAAFSHLDELEIPTERAEVDHAWHLYVVRLKDDRGLSRENFIAQLRQHRISTSVHFIPVHLFTYYREKYGFQPDDFPVAYREYKRIVSLPLYPGLTDQDVEDVIEAVISVARRHGR